MSNKDKPIKNSKPENWTVEDEASWESFPASDPPSWTIGKNESETVPHRPPIK